MGLVETQESESERGENLCRESISIMRSH